MIVTDKAEKYRRAIALHGEGLSVSAIAREVGESRQLVDYWLKGRSRPRSLSEQSKTTRREYMRDFMRKKRTEQRVARLMS